jgi:RES domain-containing protein
MVYASATLSLAALEYFVHVDGRQAPADLVAVPADVPDAVSRTRLEANALPRNWRRYPAPPALADLGSRWANDARTAILVVPSAVIPAEANYLLNPRHSDFAKIRLGQPQPFSFDPRMWKR